MKSFEEQVWNYQHDMPSDWFMHGAGCKIQLALIGFEIICCQFIQRLAIITVIPSKPDGGGIRKL